MSLEETLSLLSSLLPEVPGLVDDLLKQSDEVKSAARALLAKAEEKRRLADEGSQQARQALATARDEASRQKIEKDGAWTAAEAAFNQAEQTRQAEEAELSTAVDGAEAAFSSLTTELQDTGTSVRTAVDQLGQDLGTVDEALRTGAQELASAADAAAAGMGTLGTSAESLKTELSQALQGLGEHMDKTLEKARARLEQTLEAVRKLQAEHETHVGAMGGRVSDNCDNVEKETKDEVNDKVVTPLHDQLEGLEEAFAKLDVTLEDAQEASRVHRDGIEGLFADLSTALEPMPRAIDSVKQAANDVGLSWG